MDVLPRDLAKSRSCNLTGTSAARQQQPGFGIAGTLTLTSIYNKMVFWDRIMQEYVENKMLKYWNTFYFHDPSHDLILD